MKSVVSGVAGSARIVQLNTAALTRAENHGKRLDHTGKARAINDTPAETTTGLNLKALYAAHIANAFIPKGDTKALHMILQFPKELVDEDDAAGMLYHARAFAARVFGPNAVFGDRIDRDEKNKQLVDLFIAPKYVKRTKRSEKIAVSMSRDLKQLATKHGHRPIPQGMGRALQDELYEYFRDVMKLDRVQRGAKKVFAGPDWKSAEQQRLEELEEIERVLERERAAVKEKTTDLAAKFDEVNDRAAVLDKRRDALAEEKKRLEELEWDLAGRQARAEARESEVKRKEDDIAARETSLDRRTREADVRESETVAALAIAQTARAAADQASADMRAQSLAAAHDRDEAAADAAEAKKLRADAEAERAKAAAERDAVAAERTKLEGRHALHEAQLALLARAADDNNDLRLRTTEKGFSMNQGAMTEEERETYRRPWSPVLERIARQLARALEHVRERARQLLKIEDREAAVTAREQAVERELSEQREAQRREHETSIANLDRRRDTLRAEEGRIAIAVAEAEAKLAAATAMQVSAEAKMATATEKQAIADADVSRNQRWMRAITAIDSDPNCVELSETGELRPAPGISPEEAPAITAVVGERSPSWARSIIWLQMDLADSIKTAADRESQAASAVERLTDMVNRAGPVLTPAQRDVATEAIHVAKQFDRGGRAGTDGMEI